MEADWNESPADLSGLLMLLLLLSSEVFAGGEEFVVAVKSAVDKDDHFCRRMNCRL